MFYVENNKEKLIDVMVNEGLTYLKFGFDYDGTKILINGR